MIGDISKADKIFIACGKTDLRKSIDGLATLVQQKFHLNPFENSVFLFSGNQNNRMKALYWEKDGFILLYKRLENGKFKWPKDAADVRQLSSKELRWLLEGLKIDQPKAIQKAVCDKII